MGAEALSPVSRLDLTGDGESEIFKKQGRLILMCSADSPAFSKNLDTRTMPLCLEIKKL